MSVPWKLIDAHFDEELTPEQASELSAWLRGDEEHLRLLVREAHFRTCLRAELTNAEALKETSSLVPFPTSDVAAKWRFQRFTVRQQALALAASIAVLVGFAFWYFGARMGEPLVADLQGTGAVIERGTQWIAATKGIALQPGDKLRTGRDGNLTVGFGLERTTFDLSSNSELSVTSFRRGKNFRLTAGTLEAEVARQRPLAPLTLTTPNASAMVIGTRFAIRADTNLTELKVTQGKVLLADSASGANIKVSAGEYGRVAPGVELTALPATGRILREYWTNSAVNFSRSVAPGQRPDGWDYLQRFESKAVKPGVRFKERIRGYVHPPVTGLYRFAVSQAHAETALHVSRTDNPRDVVQVAYAWRDPEFHAPGLDQVTPIPLTAGRKYYIEVVHTSDGGEDNLTIVWQTPGGAREILPGKFLSPFPIDERKGK